MTDKQLDWLLYLLESIETDEGLCYKTRSECSPTCPLWTLGPFDGNVCLANVLHRKVKRIAYDKRLHAKKNNDETRGGAKQ